MYWRLNQGDMLLESIKELIAKEGIKDAVVISAIGTLDMCVLHMVTTYRLSSRGAF